MFVITAVIFSVLLIVFLILNVYWGFVFIRRIRSNLKYMKRLVKNLKDEESGESYQNLIIHHKTEIWKNFFLYLINATEMLALLYYYTAGMVRYSIVDNNLYNVTIQLYINECSTIVDTSVLNQLFQNPILVFPYVHWIDAFINLEVLLVPTLGICLMQYLILRMKEIDHLYTRFMCLFLTPTILLCVLTTITGFGPYLYIIGTVLSIISNFLYFALFVRFSNRFKRALFQLALQCLTQRGTNVREMRQYKYFKYSMNIVCIGFFFTMIGRSSVLFEYALVSGLFFPKCYFPFNFLSPFTFLVQSEYATRIFFQTMFIVTIISECIMLIGILIWLLPFIVITVNIWIMQIYKHIHKAPKIKYTTVNSIEEPLMSSC